MDAAARFGRYAPSAAPRRSCRSRIGVRGIEDRSGAQHGAGHLEQAVGDRAQSARVAVAPGPQRLVLLPARFVPLGGGAGTQW